MFQYAAGLALARSRNMNFKLDVSGFSSYSQHHGYELERVFKSQSALASEQDLKDILGWQYSPLVRRILKRVWMTPLRKSSLLMESGFPYTDLESKVSDCGYLSGYWQSEKYFMNYANEVRESFKFGSIINPENVKWTELISRVNSISIHVRRGDFISTKNVAYHGACSVEYFTSATRYIMARISSPEFFVFSDDIEWAKANISPSAPCHFVSNNSGANSFNDMRLMSLCKHNIIANSSFSWWGAWLNANNSKIVIAPAKWFAADVDTCDLLPPSWVTL